jgi:hypothetical protein
MPVGDRVRAASCATQYPTLLAGGPGWIPPPSF